MAAQDLEFWSVALRPSVMESPSAMTLIGFVSPSELRHVSSPR